MNYNHNHTPVLVKYLLDNFQLSNSAIVIDGTMGFAGHAKSILNLYPTINYYGFDKDTFAIEAATKECDSFDNVTIFNQPFSSMFKTIDDHPIKNLSHILLDLGVSSYQIDSSQRGFSFQKDEPLDMRMDKSQELTAEVVINQYSKDVLLSLLIDEGNVRQPQRLVDHILKTRTNTPITTTFQLIDIIKQSVFVRSRSQLIAEVTKVFQAIRVAVNDEMGELNSFLENVLHLKGVIVAIITFQPNEDRKVKHFVKYHKLEAITKKPLQSTYHERKKNPREKTAKLRIFKV